MKVAVVGAGLKEKAAFLRANKMEIIAMKRAERKCADIFTMVEGVRANKASLQALNIVYENDTENGILKRSIIANTYNWLDSHDDVHIKGVFTKTIKDNAANKLFHLHDHKFETTAKVGTPQSYAEKDFQWKDLGVDKAGTTTALVLVSQIEKSMNKAIYKAYLNDEIDQHSVSMSYVKMDLAINDPEDKEHYDVWKTYIGVLGNKEAAMEQGYFWAIKEAKLFETSCVLQGSNEITPTLIPSKKEPSEDTLEPVNPLNTYKAGGFSLNLNKL